MRRSGPVSRARRAFVDRLRTASSSRHVSAERSSRSAASSSRVSRHVPYPTSDIWSFPSGESLALSFSGRKAEEETVRVTRMHEQQVVTVDIAEDRGSALLHRPCRSTDIVDADGDHVHALTALG